MARRREERGESPPPPLLVSVSSASAGSYMTGEEEVKTSVSSASPPSLPAQGESQKWDPPPDKKSLFLERKRHGGLFLEATFPLPLWILLVSFKEKRKEMCLSLLLSQWDLCGFLSVAESRKKRPLPPQF